MTTPEKVTLSLGTGNALTFDLYSPNSGWNDVPAVYIFAQKQGETIYVPYVGETDSLKNRLSNHERWPEAAKMGANRIGVLIENNPTTRAMWEQTLIKRLQPPMNTQHKNALAR